MTRAVTGGVAALLAGATLFAQQALTPTFRVRVDAIELEAFVPDARGTPVTGLTADEFQILEDGRPQTITSFSQIDIPFERRSRAFGLDAALGTMSPDVVANDHSDGRVYMFVMDEVPPGVALRSRVFVRR